MSLRPVASLALKLLALWMLVPLLDSLRGLIQIANPSINASFGASGTRSFMLSIAVPLVLRLCWGIVLWLFSDGIAASMVKDDQLFTSLPTPLEWQRLAFSVLGAYFCVSAAEGLGGVLMKAYLVAHDQIAVQTVQIGAADVVPLVVRGVLGIVLLFGLRGLVRGAANLKNVGREVDAS